MYSIHQVEQMVEESSALFECYVERLMESENVNDFVSASHWYTDAVFSWMLSQPHK
jgi:hypothetical protein